MQEHGRGDVEVAIVSGTAFTGALFHFLFVGWK